MVGFYWNFWKGKFQPWLDLYFIQNIHPLCYELWPKTGECVDFQDKQGIHPYTPNRSLPNIDKASTYHKGRRKTKKGNEGSLYGFISRR